MQRLKYSGEEQPEEEEKEFEEEGGKCGRKGYWFENKK